MPKQIGRLSGFEIKSIFSRGERQNTPFLSVYWRKTGQKSARVAYIVSKTVDKSAVSRNRLRRIIREFLRNKHQELSGFDVVFILKPAAAKLNPAELRRAVEDLMGWGLLKPSHENNST
jgi:ribonuclease P protein component